MPETPGPSPEAARPAVAHPAETAHAIDQLVPVEMADRPAPSSTSGRQLLVPSLLFLATCVTTFWAGAAGDLAEVLFTSPLQVPDLILQNWQRGLIYMAAVMAILLAHELGHFFTAMYHRVPASLPFFLPMPISPIGTMGAVIAMQGFRANRKELFDIGLAGPLAGLVLAVPIVWLGVLWAAPEQPGFQSVLTFHNPLLVDLLIRFLRPEDQHLVLARNPFLQAGWVGLVITGLNMMTISQLDGGHISYALFGRKAHYIARMLFVTAVAGVVVAEAYGYFLMLAILLLLRVDHPPTADDRVELGWGRRIIGLASLLIPVLCFPPQGISVAVGP